MSLPVLAGTTTEAALGALPGVYTSVFLWTDFVNAIASQTRNMQSQNVTGFWLRYLRNDNSTFMGHHTNMLV